MAAGVKGGWWLQYGGDCVGLAEKGPGPGGPGGPGAEMRGS